MQQVAFSNKHGNDSEETLGFQSDHKLRVQQRVLSKNNDNINNNNHIHIKMITFSSTWETLAFSGFLSHVKRLWEGQK